MQNVTLCCYCFLFNDHTKDFYSYLFGKKVTILIYVSERKVENCESQM